MIDKDRLKAARAAAGLSQAALAERAGVAQQLVSALERGSYDNTSKLPEIARALGVVPGDLDPDYAAGGPPAVATVIPAIGQRVGRGGDLPVYASAQGGIGEIIVSFEAIDYVGRPDALGTVRDGYGMYVVGDSMSPRYEPGDMALVNPHRPAKSGDDVVLFRQPPVGPTEALVKRLIRHNADRWVVQQFNPAKEFKLPKAEWPVCHVIVGRY